VTAYTNHRKTSSAKRNSGQKPKLSERDRHTLEKAMANYPQELAQDALCQSYTGHMTGPGSCQARPSRLNTNE